MGTRVGFIASAVLAASLLWSGPAFAEEPAGHHAAEHAGGGEQYQTEVSVSYSRIEADLDSRDTQYGVKAQVYFEPVKTEEHPYAEAAFLERIGSIAVTADKLESSGGMIKGSGPLYAADLTLAKPGQSVAVEIIYAYSKVDLDTLNFSGFATIRNQAAGVRLGNYFTDTFFAGLQYTYTDIGGTVRAGGAPDLRGRDYGVFAKYVMEFGHHRELSIEAELVKATASFAEETTRNTDVSIAADYFFNKSLSVGAGFANSSGTEEAVEGQTWSANVRYFISPRLSVQALYSRFLNSHPLLVVSTSPVKFAPSDRTYGFVVAGRF